MVQLDLPTLCGLVRTKDGGFRPRRISMFPPSYADRAMARYLKRQNLRDSDNPKTKSLPTPRKQNEESLMSPASNASNQTDMTYCYHECPCHKEAKTSNTVTIPGKKGGSKKQGSQLQDGEKKGNQSSKDKNNKAKPTKAKKDDSDSSIASDEDLSATNVPKKSQGKKAGKQAIKQGKNNKAKPTQARKDDSDSSIAFDEDLSATNVPKKSQEKQAGKQATKQGQKENTEPRPLWPPMKVPWSTHLSPSPYDQNSKERFSDPAIFLPGQTRQVKSSIGKEAPGPSYDATSWRLDEAFDLARTADEEYISLWLDHEEGRHQQGALKWLEDRDSRRRNLVYPVPVYDDAGSKRVKFAPPGRLISSRPGLRSAKHHRTFDARSDSSSDIDPPQKSYGKTLATDSIDPLVVYQDEGNKMYTANGREILIMPKPGSAHVPKTMGSNNALGNQRDSAENMPQLMHGALQPTSGNASPVEPNHYHIGSPRDERVGATFQIPQPNQIPNQPFHKNQVPSHPLHNNQIPSQPLYNKNPGWVGSFNRPASDQGDNRSSNERGQSNKNWDPAGQAGNQGPGPSGGWNSNTQGASDNKGWDNAAWSDHGNDISGGENNDHNMGSNNQNSSWVGNNQTNSWVGNKRDSNPSGDYRGSNWGGNNQNSTWGGDNQENKWGSNGSNMRNDGWGNQNTSQMPQQSQGMVNHNQANENQDSNNCWGQKGASQQPLRNPTSDGGALSPGVPMNGNMPHAPQHSNMNRGPKNFSNQGNLASSHAQVDW